jgi:hypothetical protein
MPAAAHGADGAPARNSPPDLPVCYDVARRSFVRCTQCYTPTTKTWNGGLCTACSGEFRGGGLSAMTDPARGRARIEARREIQLAAWRATAGR